MSYIGHENIKDELNKVVKSGSISHAYLFVGKDGIGKKKVALDFAKDILCLENADGHACGKCDACLKFESNPDLQVLIPEKGAIKVDSVREFTREMFLLPTVSNRKVFIIDEAETMNEQAQNALLKCLEEPPLYASIILITSNKEKLLRTIKSRVAEVAFDSLSKDEIKKILEENNVEVLPEALDYANGSAKKAMEFINDDTIEISQELFKLVLKRDFLELNRKFEQVKADKKLKEQIEHILENIMHLCFNTLKQDVTFDYKIIELLEKTIQKIRRRANVDLALDVFMLDICKV